VVLAHQIANVDALSRGRVVLGLGVGWSLPSAEREWAACGMDHRRRVQRLEEHVEIWRMLWRGEPVTHRGHGVDLVEHTIGPLPWNAAGPPVLITAGNRGEFLPRSSSGSRGWRRHHHHVRRRRRVPAPARAGEEASTAQPHVARVSLCVYTTVRLDDDVARAERTTREFLATYYGGGVHLRGLMGLGPADAVIGALQRYADAGVTDLCVRFVGDDQQAQLERFTKEILPAVA